MAAPRGETIDPDRLPSVVRAVPEDAHANRHGTRPEGVRSYGAVVSLERGALPFRLTHR